MTKLNLGAGKEERLGYTNIDFSPHPTVHIVHDLRNGIPFPDESVEEVMSHHVIDYFSYPEVAKLLAECYRVLKKGGKCAHTVPDLRSAGEALHAYGIEALWMRDIFWGAMPGPNNTDIFKKSGFDQDLLKKYFEGTGFRSIEVINHGPRYLENQPPGGVIKNFDFTVIGTK